MNTKSISCLALGMVFSVVSSAAAHRDVATLGVAKGNAQTLSVESGRLVGQSVQSLIQNYGYRISYEDPRYAFAGDLDDVTDEVLGNAAANAKTRIVVPRSAKMSVNLQQTQGPEVMLNQVIAAAAAANPSARFRVQKDEGMLHVLPSTGRDRNGNAETQTSVLDARITLPKEPRTAYETLRAICAAVTSASGKRVVVGTQGFFPYPGEDTYPVGAENEVARVVLKRALDAFEVKRGPSTWLLFYGNEQSDDEYALNVMAIPAMATANPTTPKAVPARKFDPAQDASSAAPPK